MSKTILTEKGRTVVSDSAELQSQTIDLIRFPLVIMVIFIHMNPSVVNLCEADFALLSGHGLYNITGVLLSHVLTSIAVPTFFLISGFLFFVNFREWSLEGYRKKMRSRVKSLVVPYFLWNIIPYLLFVSTMLAGAILKGRPVESVYDMIADNSWHILYDCKEWDTTCINWLGDNLRMTGPWVLPLWFLRDLIVVTALTPLIYWVVKRLKIFVLAILFLAYISRIWTLLPGFNITAFFYFTTGAYFALNGIDIVQFANKYGRLFIPVCVVCLVIATIYDGGNTIVGQNIMPFYVCTGVFCAFYVASKCISRFNMKPSKLLVSSCFFIYAIHSVAFPLIGSPLTISYDTLHAVIPGNSGIEEGVCYILSPFVAAMLCIVILLVARRIAPRLTLLFSGNK